MASVFGIRSKPTPRQLGVFEEFRSWDKCNKRQRKKILQEFVDKYGSTLVIDLEADYSGSASLFLTRIYSWLCLTYQLDVNCLTLQLQSLQIFFRSVHSGKYLSEFAASGGISTVLDCFSVTSVTEDAIEAAVSLLYRIVQFEKQYKEFVCHENGLWIIRSVLRSVHRVQTLQAIGNLLRSLLDGSTSFQEEAEVLLFEMIATSNPRVQLVAIATLKGSLNSVQLKTEHLAALMECSQSTNLELQHAGDEMIKMLIQTVIEEENRDYSEKLRMRQAILDDLLEGLRPVELRSESLQTVPNPPAPIDSAPPLDQGGSMIMRVVPREYCRQAACARLLGSLGPSFSQWHWPSDNKTLLNGLLVALTNSRFYDSQKSAGIALAVLCSLYHEIAHLVMNLFGSELYQKMMLRPESFMRSVSVELLDSLSLGVSLDQTITPSLETQTRTPRPSDMKQRTESIYSTASEAGNVDISFPSPLLSTAPSPEKPAKIEITPTMLQKAESTQSRASDSALPESTKSPVDGELYVPFAVDFSASSLDSPERVSFLQSTNKTSTVQRVSEEETMGLMMEEAKKSAKHQLELHVREQ